LAGRNPCRFSPESEPFPATFFLSTRELLAVSFHHFCRNNPCAESEPRLHNRRKGQEFHCRNKAVRKWETPGTALKTQGGLANPSPSCSSRTVLVRTRCITQVSTHPNGEHTEEQPSSLCTAILTARSLRWSQKVFTISGFQPRHTIFRQPNLNSWSLLFRDPFLVRFAPGSETEPW